MSTLLFLGDRYRVVLSGISDETLRDWRELLAQGTLGPDVVDIRRRGDRDVEVIRSGLHFEGGGKGPGEMSLSIYYRFVTEFDPFTGGRDAQAYIGEWEFRKDARKQRLAR